MKKSIKNSTKHLQVISNEAAIKIKGGTDRPKATIIKAPVLKPSH